eukprot:TRINITY_DN28353_c0_g1_i1.p1 TRINITY_DN28353_c0_g1~~TRINITY_DN28353_c0_g1_i1.p1  ORF type:complete len:245 (+),score=95.68 TRINITY_DN28353_c0_g1_i1:86-820(+)
MRQVTNLVFDVSGVLRDTRRLMKRSYDVAFAAHGVGIDVQESMVYKLRGLEDFNDVRNSFRLLLGTKGDLHERVMGTKGANKLLVEEMNARPVDEALVESLQAAYWAEFARDENKDLVTLLPGVADGLARLAGTHRLAVLSNAPMVSIQRDLGPDLLRHFAFTIADAGKPDPAVLHSALADHGIPPERVAYVGDAVSDVALAQAAGVASVAMLSGMGAPKHLKAKEPDMVCADFAEFVEKIAAA